MKTWRELKAEGVKRCNAMFKDGRQCRRRANADGSWCGKHAPIMRRIEEAENEMLQKEYRE
jgi:hypothetical protein